jgi:putative salt-induced outer membrane protein
MSGAAMAQRLWPILVAAFAAPAAGMAQTPATAPLIRAQIDLGLVSTSGNSRVRTLNVGEQLVVRPEPWRFTQTFSVVNGYSGGVETVNTLAAGLRADYSVGARFRLYALGQFTRNRFAGIARRFEEAVGLAYGLLAGPVNILDFEAGAGRNQQIGALGPLQQYWVSRLAVRYRFNFTSRALFEQKVEHLADFENLKNMFINTESALVAPISNNVGLKLGYVVHFANQPQSGFKKADTILSAGLQLLF